METKETLLKGEIESLEQLLYNCYDYCLFTSAFEDKNKKRLKKRKLIELLFEINEKLFTFYINYYDIKLIQKLMINEIIFNEITIVMIKVFIMNHIQNTFSFLSFN